jgi:hypothetical protein
MITKALVVFKKVFKDINLIPRQGHLIATRPCGPLKCKKVLMRIPIGGAIPPGVILTKGTIIDLEV